MVDLGAGDGVKTLILLQECLRLKKDVIYIPTDISQDSNEKLGKILKERMPNAQATILTGQYEESMKFICSTFPKPSLITMFGPNIGNYTRSETQEFLRMLHGSMKPSDELLISFDLKKDAKIIDHAYYDSKGVSEKFVINLLHRINLELKGHFDSDRFVYRSYYDNYDSCVKVFLVSNAEQDVAVDAIGQTFHFEQYEPILVAESHKYSLKEIEQLAGLCGFGIIEHFHDERKYSVGCLWRKL